jgi:hypothetical protein
MGLKSTYPLSSAGSNKMDIEEIRRLLAHLDVHLSMDDIKCLEEIRQKRLAGIKQKWLETSDREVIKAATINKTGYPADVQEIIQEEVRRRGLSEEVENWSTSKKPPFLTDVWFRAGVHFGKIINFRKPQMANLAIDKEQNMSINKKQIVLIWLTVFLMFLIYVEEYPRRDIQFMRIGMLWFLLVIATIPILYLLRTKNKKTETIISNLDQVEELVFKAIAVDEKNKEAAVEEMLRVKQKFNQIKDMLK